MTPGTFLLWYDLDQHFVSIRFCGKIGYWTHLWRSVHESKHTSWYVLDCPRPHGLTHIRVRYHPGDMCGDPECGLVCQGDNQCLQTGAVCVTSPCCPAHACSSTINKSQLIVPCSTKGPMEDQTIAWARGMTPVQLCVTPGYFRFLFFLCFSSVQLFPFVWFLYLFQGTSVTFEWTSGHNMQEVDIKLPKKQKSINKKSITL